MDNSRKKIVISLSILAFLFIAIIGVSYAFYMANVTGNTATDPSLTLKSGYLKIVYTGGQEFIPTESDGSITQDKAYTKTFTVTNDGVKGASYSIWLKDVVNPFTRTQDWTYKLSKGDDILIDSTVFPTTDKEILVSRYLKVNESETLTLSVTYASSSENQSVDMNKSLEFNVSVIQTEYENPIENAQSGTLLYSIKRDNTVSEPLTVPGQQASTSSEAVLATTEDDYGTSYYYRGNVTNNYINYSGMCWRIVRVQGDGTIKLVLADENGECNASTYSTTNTKSAFVDERMNIIYKSNAAYSISDLLFETSNIPTILSSWSTSSEHTLDTSKLVDAEWCNDTAKTSVSQNISNYGAYDRLYNVSTATPTLKCNTKGMTGTSGIETNAQLYTNKLGILSADEVAFAGSTFSQSETTYNHYLLTNASGNWYWTMTPFTFSSNNNYSAMYRVYTNGILYNYYAFNDGGSLRPAIVLNADVKLNISGNGTQTNPYVIN